MQCWFNPGGAGSGVQGELGLGSSGCLLRAHRPDSRVIPHDLGMARMTFFHFLFKHFFQPLSGPHFYQFWCPTHPDVDGFGSILGAFLEIPFKSEN